MAEKYIKQIDVRWADLDPNFHMLHSKYYDLGAYVRMCMFYDFGITADEIRTGGASPILFREECSFRREIGFGDKVSIDAELVKMKKDASRWTIRHQILKGDDKLSATIIVDGAWIGLETRKLTIPPTSFIDAFSKFPKAQDFELVD